VIWCDKMMGLLVLVSCFGAAVSAEYTTSSTDIRVCISETVLSDERDALQTEVLSALNRALSTDNAVYPLRRYTLDGVCYIFLYQAQSPEAARDSVLQLRDLTVVSFNGDLLQAQVTAVPWRGEELPLGAPSIQTLMIWFITCATLLFSCMCCMCCFVALRPISSSKTVKSRA
jgi:hypothetical protein